MVLQSRVLSTVVQFGSGAAKWGDASNTHAALPQLAPGDDHMASDCWHLLAVVVPLPEYHRLSQHVADLFRFHQPLDHLMCDMRCALHRTSLQPIQSHQRQRPPRCRFGLVTIGRWGSGPVRRGLKIFSANSVFLVLLGFQMISTLQMQMVQRSVWDQFREMFRLRSQLTKISFPTSFFSNQT